MFMLSGETRGRGKYKNFIEQKKPNTKTNRSMYIVHCTHVYILIFYSIIILDLDFFFYENRKAKNIISKILKFFFFYLKIDAFHL